MLTQNLIPEQGLMNGTQGTIKKIVYATKEGPLSADPNDALPRYLVIDFPQYVGPAYYSEPDRSTWVPVEPREIQKEDLRETRTRKRTES